MQAVYLLAVALLFYVFSYRFYGRFFSRKVMDAGDASTPAAKFNDGVDFVPTPRSVLAGFHFKGIAGIGPVAGAIVALQWGWLPAIIWLILGNVLMGWVQDYGSLLMSVRSNGQTLGPVSERFLSRRSRNILLVFIVCFLLLLISVFGIMVGGLFSKNTQIVLPVLSVIVAGLVFGVLGRSFGLGVLPSTAIAVAIGMAGIYFGASVPFPAFGLNAYLAGLLLFSIVGAVLPVTKWLQPVNYVATAVIGIVMILAFFGILAGNPVLEAPAFAGFVSGIGPLFPVLFVTIACGAISGFHSLTSTTGTSRMLSSERDGLPVAAGAMHAEGILGIIALIAAAVVAPAAYSAQIKGGAAGAASVFGAGMGTIVSAIGLPQAFSATLGLVVFSLLALTLMHLALRFVAIIAAELLGGQVQAMRRREAGAVCGAFAAFLLAQGSSWKSLWVLFGSSNQLLAVLSLSLVSLWLLEQKRSIRYTILPAAFMSVVTLTALVFVMRNLVNSTLAGLQPGAAAELSGAVLPNALAAALGAVLLVCVFFLMRDFLVKLRSLRRNGT